jgi:hypothetical protein
VAALLGGRVTRVGRSPWSRVEVGAKES